MLRRVKNMSRQNPLPVQLDTKNPHTGQRECIYLLRGETKDLTKPQFRSGHVQKFLKSGYLKEVPVPKKEPAEEPVAVVDTPDE